MNIGFISLGCSKNLIDTEVMIGKFKNNNFNIVNEPQNADIILINTCGFIESAKEEAVNTILEMAEYKKKRCKYLIVTGCLVQRYYVELKKSLPEVDLFLKIEDYKNLWNKIEELIDLKAKKKENRNKSNRESENESNNKENRDENNSENEKESKSDNNKKAKILALPMFGEREYLARTISTGKNYAYLKIGEGCSNMCTYCAIPYIRGLFVSRPMEDILEEAKMLAKKGIKEIIVIAQDTTKYGIDLYGKSALAELLEKLAKIDGIKWIRFLYSYPEGITDELIKVVKENDNICKYFDIPIQHISDNILKKMNRKTSKKDIENLLKKIKEQIPNVILRTSLIVGFPGETKKDFEELYEFVKFSQFDKLGVFKYSKEDGTPAATMQNQIHYKTKEYRRNEVMELQQKISKEKLEKNIGKTIEVLIENVPFDGKYLVGRTANDVPEEDGVVYIENKYQNENMISKFVKCKVTSVNAYDLVAKIV